MECTQREAGLLAVSSMGTATLHEGQLEGCDTTGLLRGFILSSGSSVSMGHRSQQLWLFYFLHPLPAQTAKGTLNQEDDQHR